MGRPQSRELKEAAHTPARVAVSSGTTPWVLSSAIARAVCSTRVRRLERVGRITEGLHGSRTHELRPSIAEEGSVPEIRNFIYLPPNLVAVGSLRPDITTNARKSFQMPEATKIMTWKNVEDGVADWVGSRLVSGILEAGCCQRTVIEFVSDGQKKGGRGHASAHPCRHRARQLKQIGSLPSPSGQRERSCWREPKCSGTALGLCPNHFHIKAACSCVALLVCFLELSSMSSKIVSTFASLGAARSKTLLLMDRPVARSFPSPHPRNCFNMDQHQPPSNQCRILP